MGIGGAVLRLWMRIFSYDRGFECGESAYMVALQRTLRWHCSSRPLQQLDLVVLHSSSNSAISGLVAR